MRVRIAWIALLAMGCGSRSGLRLPEPAATTTDGGSSTNPLCSNLAPGEVVTLLSGKIQPAHIGVSGERLVVAEWPFTGDVFRLPKAGGSVDALSDDEAAVNQLVADADAAYWVVQGLGDSDGAVRSASSGTSKASTVVGSLTRPKGIASFGEFLYFTDGIGPPKDSSNGRVHRLKRGTNQPSVLADGLTDPWAIAVDATGVYFTHGGGVFALSLNGGGLEQLTFSEGLPQHLATDGQQLFWSDTAGSVYRRDHATGTVSQIATGLGSIEGIAADSAGAYLVQRTGPSDVAIGAVYAIRHDGLEWLASSSQAPLGIAIDVSAIYFVAIDGAMGSVSMLCREP